jgi:AraC-like DNA-binding protein
MTFTVMAKTNSVSLAPLLKILDQKMLPWIEADGASRLIVARPSFAEMTSRGNEDGLAGVQITAKKRQGHRVRIKSARQYRNSSILAAEWPADAQHEVRFAALACVVSGVADLRLADYVLHCPAGTLVLLPPEIPQPDGTHPHFESESSADRCCDVLWLSPWLGGQNGMECWLCHSLGERHWNLDPGENCFISNPQIVQHFHALVEEATAQQSDSKKICSHLLNVLLAVLRREINAGQVFQPGRIAAATRETDNPDPIAQAQQYICSHLNKPLTIDIVSHAVFMSRAQFTKRFRQESGQSFNEFITRQRLSAASDLLRESDWSVQMIAQFVGLKDAQLRNLFHRHFDQTPGEFRRNQTEANSVKPSRKRP